MKKLRVTSCEMGVQRLGYGEGCRQPVSPLAARALRPAPRGAVTLIELLIAIAIIATLSAVFLGVSSAAMEQARASRTKTLIAKIHTLVMERWESYEMRRVNITATATGYDLHSARLNGLRYLMKLEMPDRWSDILGKETDIGAEVAAPNLPGSAIPPAYKQYSYDLQGGGTATATMPYPAITKSYLRRYNNLKNTDPAIIRKHQGAECLYMIVMLFTGDGEARTLFNAQNIGDTDEDGAPEFLDGWGQPIEWLRWPVGFNSDIQPLTSPGVGNADADHDPFDPFRIDRTAFRIVPLIFSPGPDGILDIASATRAVTGIDPFVTAGDSGTHLGTQRDNPDALDGDQNWLDNIHNHLQDNR